MQNKKVVGILGALALVLSYVGIRILDEPQAEKPNAVKAIEEGAYRNNAPEAVVDNAIKAKWGKELAKVIDGKISSYNAKSVKAKQDIEMFNLTNQPQLIKMAVDDYNVSQKMSLLLGAAKVACLEDSIRVFKGYSLTTATIDLNNNIMSAESVQRAMAGTNMNMQQMNNYDFNIGGLTLMITDMPPLPINITPIERKAPPHLGR